jgi:hypothetical protein
MKRLLLLGIAAGLTLFLATCAPREDPAPPRTPDTAQAESAVNKTLVVPSGLEARISAALENVHRRDLLTTHGFWTIFHGILGQGLDTTLLDPETGQRVKAIEQICRGAPIRGLEFIATPDGLDVRTMVGTGVGQGHQDQFIAEMTQWSMPRTRPFVVNGHSYTFEDFIRHARMRASLTKGQELSWVIIIVSQYYGTDHRWTNSFGESLSLENVVRYELDQPIDTAACGGTHRLFGLTWAYHLHLAKGGQPTGVWKDVADKIALYKHKAHQFQNPDGSFSSEYVSKPGYTQNPDRRINTTGHVLEWLALSMTDAALREPWMEQAANALSVMILEHRTDPLDGGSLYHATHGLYIYRARVFGVPGPDGLLMPLPAKGSEVQKSAHNSPRRSTTAHR